MDGFIPSGSAVRAALRLRATGDDHAGLPGGMTTFVSSSPHRASAGRRRTLDMRTGSHRHGPRTPARWPPPEAMPGRARPRSVSIGIHRRGSARRNRCDPPPARPAGTWRRCRRVPAMPHRPARCRPRGAFGVGAVALALASARSCTAARARRARPARRRAHSPPPARPRDSIAAKRNAGEHQGERVAPLQPLRAAAGTGGARRSAKSPSVDRPACREVAPSARLRRAGALLTIAAGGPASGAERSMRARVSRSRRSRWICRAPPASFDQLLWRGAPPLRARSGGDKHARIRAMKA